MKKILLKLRDYNFWANKEIISHFKMLDTFPQKALSLFAHILRAEQIWFLRSKGQDTSGMEIFPAFSLEECVQLYEVNYINFKTLFAEITGEDLNKIIEYKITKGQLFKTPLNEILLHVFNHSTYHRGQIMLNLVETNIPPIITDFIYYSRMNIM